ncbi:MAG TPA: hypothetical protein ENI61_00215 [Ignavibacteria bacterium]|nr:hypothetical protein [Ignavibacteria bacterium]
MKETKKEIQDLGYEDLSKGGKILANLYSRDNTLNGKYREAQIGLDDLLRVKENDILFLETLKIRADSADKIIAEAEKQGRDTTDPIVMIELGKEINALGELIHRSEAIMTAFFVSSKLIVYCGIAISIWGLVFNKSFLIFGFYGAVVGLIISLLFVAPVISFQRNKKRIRNLVSGVGMLLIPIIFIVGVVGLVALIIKSIFF